VPNCSLRELQLNETEVVEEYLLLGGNTGGEAVSCGRWASGMLEFGFQLDSFVHTRWL